MGSYVAKEVGKERYPKNLKKLKTIKNNPIKSIIKPKRLKVGSCKKIVPNKTYKKIRANGNSAFHLEISTILSVTVYLLPKIVSIASKDSLCVVSILVAPDCKST